MNERNFLIPKSINKIYFNCDPINNNQQNIIQEKFSFKKFVLDNINKININQKEFIKPIYVSNNLN